MLNEIYNQKKKKPMQAINVIKKTECMVKVCQF